MKKSIRNALVGLASFSSPAFAAAEASGDSGSFLLTLFIGFFALIIVCLKRCTFPFIYFQNQRICAYWKQEEKSQNNY